MDFQGMLDKCRSLKGVTEDFPFDETTLVFRIGGKIFALTDIERGIPRVNLKCDPEMAEAFRSEYSSVTPGYHMNKLHWNTVFLDGSVPEVKLNWMIEHSYDLIFRSLSRKVRDSIDPLELGSEMP